MNKGKLYLIPVFLGDEGKPDSVFPSENILYLNELTHFVVENEKYARRFLKRAGYCKPIQEANMELLNEHTKQDSVMELLQPALNGLDIGLLSDAGCPGVADPGATLVQWAHELGIEVIPLVGPSSILLSLMASGMNGQQFAFLGYLPVDKLERQRKLKELSGKVFKDNQTQIFIETPYRNMHLFEEILKSCNSNLRLCVACNLSQPGGWVRTFSVGQWQKHKIDIQKKPCVFLLGL